MKELVFFSLMLFYLCLITKGGHLRPTFKVKNILLLFSRLLMITGWNSQVVMIEIIFQTY